MLTNMPNLSKKNVLGLFILAFAITIVGFFISPDYVFVWGGLYIGAVLSVFIVMLVMVALSDRARDKLGTISTDKFITKTLPSTMGVAAALMLLMVVIVAIVATTMDIEALEVEGARRILRVEDLSLYTTFLFERLGTFDFILTALVLFLLGGYYTVSRDEERQAIIGLITGIVVFIFIIMSMNEILTVSGQSHLDAIAALSILVIFPALAIFIAGGLGFHIFSSKLLKKGSSKLIDQVWNKRMWATIVFPVILLLSVALMEATPAKTIMPIGDSYEVTVYGGVVFVDLPPTLNIDRPLLGDPIRAYHIDIADSLYDSAMKYRYNVFESYDTVSHRLTLIDSYFHEGDRIDFESRDKIVVEFVYEGKPSLGANPFFEIFGFLDLELVETIIVLIVLGLAVSFLIEFGYSFVLKPVKPFFMLKNTPRTQRRRVNPQKMKRKRIN